LILKIATILEHPVGTSRDISQMIGFKNYILNSDGSTTKITYKNIAMVDAARNAVADILAHARIVSLFAVVRANLSSYFIFHPFDGTIFMMFYTCLFNGVLKLS
jgi:hypothetical protein